MRYEAGDDRQGRGRDAGAHRIPTPSERGAEAEPDALHDPVRSEQGRSARDLGVTGAGASDEIGALRRPPGAQGRVGPDSRGTGPRGSDPRETGPREAGVPGGRTDAELSEQERGIGTERTGAARDGAAGDGADRGAAAPAGAHRAQRTAGAGDPGGSTAQLLPHGERDKLGLRLQQAVNQFVDEPRRAVEEADHVLEEATRHLVDTLAAHRSSLRGAWENKGRETDTEALRIALCTYREVTERLLQL
jgi:hypothetical protein